MNDYGRETDRPESRSHEVLDWEGNDDGYDAVSPEVPPDEEPDLADGLPAGFDEGTTPEDASPTAIDPAAAGSIAAKKVVEVVSVEIPIKEIDTSAKLRSLPAAIFGELPEQFADGMRDYERALRDSPHPYYGTLSLSASPGPEDGQIVEVRDSLGLFFGETREARRVDATNEVYDAGFRMVTTSDTSPEFVKPNVQHVLDGTYKLTENLRVVHQSKANFPNINQMTGPQRMATRRGLSAINAQEKPPVLADFMRRSIPRFTWNPISIPADAPVPEGYREQLQTAWSGYKPSESNYLISPDALAQGQAPFHMAFNAARTAEADGHSDLAYSLKTRIISDTLKMERSRTEGTEHPEIPYFEYTFPAAMTEELLGAPKGAHFDYQKAVTEVMGETWKRVEEEVQSGASGPATKFVDDLAEHYHGDLPPYLARSMVHAAKRTSFNLVGTLRDLKTAGSPWAESVIDEITALPNRPILTNAEAGDFVDNYAPTEATPPTIEAITEASAALLEKDDSDIYSLRIPLSEVAAVDPNVRATITVDVTPTEVQGLIRVKNGDRRQIPVNMSLVDGSISVDTVDANLPAAEIADKFKALLGKAVINTKTKLDAKAAAEADRKTRPAVQNSNRESVQPSQAVQNQQERVKVKTRGVPGIVEDKQTAGSEASADTSTSRHAVSLTGMDTENIQEMLSAARVSDIEAGTIVQKLSFLADKAKETNTSFGKRAPLVGVKDADRVKLREVKWRTGSGQQLRIYFREQGSGTLELCGINDKRSVTQHQNYLGKLVRKLVQKDVRDKDRSGRG